MLQSLFNQFHVRFAYRWRITALLAFAVLVAASSTLCAQHQHAATKPDSSHRTPRDSMAQMPGMNQRDHNMMLDPLGISHERMGSGTSWMPDSSPMHANHKQWGDWTGMLHGVAFGQYDDQGSRRGDKQLGIVDWEMLMAMRRVGSGMLHLHGMVSLEPATIGARGYPLLLQTGESYKGQPLHDRQHPHDFLMELAAIFQQPITKDLAIELYGGPAGEPALGPVAFMHRPSAQNDPLSPLGHHWQDATHISYGVATLGLYSRVWKLEGSWFNGREPDENRWDIDLRTFDSHSGRLSVNPTGRLSFAAWYGYLPSPEGLHPDEHVHRYGASALYGGKGVEGGSWASSLIWGANAHAGRVENSAVAETNLEIDAKNAVFGRVEYVRKSAEDLVLPSIAPDRQFDISSASGGYVREVASIPGGSIGVGGLVSVNFIPPALQTFYGTRTPAGIDVYVRVRPKRMAMAPMGEMAMPMSRDSVKGRGPAMSMPGMQPSQPGHAMPGMPMSSDSSRVHRDSSAATHMPQNMPSMPGMPMSRDSGVKRDSTKADSTGRRMPEMSGMKDMTKRPTAAASPNTAKKSARRAGAKKTAKRTKAKSDSTTKMPGTSHMPGMKPGMKMPADSTRPRKP